MMSSVAIFCVIFGWILKEKLSNSISLALASRQQGPHQGSNVMVGRLLICGEPIFGRGGRWGGGCQVWWLQIFPRDPPPPPPPPRDPPCHADNQRLPDVCCWQTPSLPSWVLIYTTSVNLSFSQFSQGNDRNAISICKWLGNKEKVESTAQSCLDQSPIISFD